MRRLLISILAAGSLLTGQAAAMAETSAAPPPPAAGQPQKLPQLANQTRVLLIKDCSQIGAAVASAQRAGPEQRTEIELGIVRAIEYLKAFDPACYATIETYLDANPLNPVVAEIQSALLALASNRGAGAGAGAGAGFGGGGGLGGGGGFASGGGPVSPH